MWRSFAGYIDSVFLCLTYYINGYTHDLQDAEDLMIDAFARIMVKKPKIQTGAFKAYLLLIRRRMPDTIAMKPL